MIARLVVPRLLASCLSAAAVLSACASGSSNAPGGYALSAADAPLPAWSQTADKRAILDYVARVTRPGSPDYIPPEHRLATFDFDGTIACEKPDYMEVMVAMTRLCELTVGEPDLLEDPLHRAACDSDFEGIDPEVEQVLLKAFSGESQSFYVDYVAKFLHTGQHPRFERPYDQLYYVPMLQLIEFLHAHEFTVYLVSGSQQGFTRTYGTNVLGISAARLIGHAVELDFSMVDGTPTLLRQESFLPPSIGGKGKAEVIRNRIGRPPVLAFGNSMGDFEMLQYATSSEYPSLGLILVHDDPDEYVYRDQELIQNAEKLGWQVVSMKNSFEVIFPHEQPSAR